MVIIEINIESYKREVGKMSDKHILSDKRGHFSSSLGFILASAGSAIGLGNLWKFPYVAGSSGGGFFLLFYILFVIILGIPLVMAEMALGRKTQLNPIGTFQKLDRRFSFIGISAVICSVFVLAFYSVVGGWVIKYLVEFLKGAEDIGGNTEIYFENFISSPIEPVIYLLIFLFLTALIVLGGIAGGIEKISKIMLPGLLVMMIIVAIRSLTLPNSIEGVKFLFLPHFEQIKSISDLSRIMMLALGQVFFSLSVGTGIILTYGSYLKHNSDITKSSVIIAVLDTIVAILSGVAILPCVFSLGFKPSGSPGMLFSTLTHVFEIIPFGRVFGVIFFLLVLFAALTSSISMLEVSASFLIDNFKISRKISILITCIIISVISSVASLSNGILSEFTIVGNTIFDLISILIDKYLTPLVSFFTCIFIGWFLGPHEITSEINIGASKVRTKALMLFSFLIKYVIPVFILIIFIMGFIK